MGISPSAKTLASLFRASNDVRPVLLLGAGASFRSGIPLAAESVKRIGKAAYIRHELGGRVHPSQVKLTQWLPWLQNQSWFIRGDDRRLAENFPLAVEHLLRPDEFRRDVLLDLIQPLNGVSSGYHVLADLMLRGLVWTVLTTNFDPCFPQALRAKQPHLKQFAQVNRGRNDFAEGAIGQLGPQEIMDRCFAGAAAICDLITRDDAGAVILIENVFVNTDQARTRGLDIEVSYDRPVDLFGGDERITTRLLGTYLREVSTTLAGAAKVDRAGQTGPAVPGGGAGGAPEWQASLNLGYERGGFSASIQERYISDGVFNATWVEGIDIDDNSVESALYTNLHLSYGTDFGGGDTRYEVWLAVSNLFDVEPAFAPNFGFTGSSHTNSSLFDIYGRRYNVGVRFNF